MKKSEIKAIVNRCIDPQNLCRIFFRYDTNYRYYFPLISNDKLFLGAEEDDFIINGYSIRRYVDVTEVQIKDDKCVEILKIEGIVNGIQMPSINISNWETVFSSLQKINRNIIVEKESINDDECDFVIGRVDRVYKKFVYVYHFDADGIWLEHPCKIRYTEITTVSFGTRYVETFSKYLKELPIKSRDNNMNIWESNNWSKINEPSFVHRTGLRLRFENEINSEIKRSCTEFCKWLRKQYYFPIRVPIYFKKSEFIISQSGEKVSAICFEPFDRHNEPYIRIATGDFNGIKQRTSHDDALAAILCSISHELTHYFQWINDIKLTEIGSERQATSYADMILYKYAETRDHP